MEGKDLWPRLEGELAPGGDLTLRAVQAIERGDVLEGLAFGDTALAGAAGVRLEFEGCRFLHCAFSPGQIKWLSFVDCAFEKCEFSGARMAGVTLRRCLWRDCRGVGLDLSGALHHMALPGLPVQLHRFGPGAAEGCMHRAKRPVAAALLETEVKALALREVSLRGAEIGGTPLAGVDLRSCDIQGIKVDVENLRGAVVTPVQACELARLMGLVID